MTNLINTRKPIVLFKETINSKVIPEIYIKHRKIENLDYSSSYSPIIHIIDNMYQHFDFSIKAKYTYVFIKNEVLNPHEVSGTHKYHFDLQSVPKDNYENIIYTTGLDTTEFYKDPIENISQINEEHIGWYKSPNSAVKYWNDTPHRKNINTYSNTRLLIRLTRCNLDLKAIIKKC